MANRRRDKKERMENGNTAMVKMTSGEVKEVTAENMAELARIGKINPKKVRFQCPGTDENGNRCTCRLQLCSWKATNKVAPYFAHRDTDSSEHIEGCDCLTDYIEYKIVKTIDESFRNLDPEGLLAEWELEDKEEGNTGGTSGGGKGPGGTGKRGKAVGIVETETEYVNIKTLPSMYTILNKAVNSNTDIKTDKNLTARELIINGNTIEEYRSGKRDLDGVKLIVAGTDALNPSLAKRVAEGFENKPFVLRDPYEITDSRIELYYVLVFKDLEIAKKYRDTLFNMTQNGNGLLLVFGKVMHLVYDDPRIRVCMVNIFNTKGKQVCELKNSEEPAEMLRSKKNDSKLL